MKEVLHFAHGNGFPSPCYRQMLQHLQKRFECYYVDQVGHTDAFPVDDNWHNLVDEVIASIKAQVSRPVIAVGHSLGGVLSLLAAIEQPSLFSAVILLDSPILGWVKSSIVRFSKALGMIDRVTPAFQTRERRGYWQSREEVLSYLRSRPLFKTFTDACLNDYIDFGLKNEDGSYSLRFDPLVEYQIYRTIPHTLYKYEGRLHTPGALIYGNKTKVVDQMDLRYMKKQFGIVNFETIGTHMFPMEHPEATAKLIMKVVDELALP